MTVASSPPGPHASTVRVGQESGVRENSVRLRLFLTIRTDRTYSVGKSEEYRRECSLIGLCWR